MTIPGESIHSPLPFDIPWWMPDHTIFFGAVYLVLGFIGAGLAFVVIKSILDTNNTKAHH